MKKAVLLFVLLLTLLVLSIYLFFPAHQTLTQSIRLHVPQKALQRVLMEQSTAQKQKTNAGAETGGATQTLSLLPDMYGGFIVRVPSKKTMHNSLIRIMTLRNDTTFVHWNAVVRGGNAPWHRIQTWREGKHIKSEVQKFLSDLRKWEQADHTYGFAVNRERVKDTSFIATSFTTDAYPATRVIYEHIGLLEQYATKQGAEVVGYPMLHVQTTGSGFEAMVALPLNKVLPETGAFKPKRMIMGNILTAEIKGGAARVEESMQQLHHYVADHSYASPAIPFLSLVTNRMEEQDSTKWVTKIYYPII